MINFWGLILTVLLFEIIKRIKWIKIPSMLATGLILMAILFIFKIDYASYNESACFLTLLLGPATIALALPLSDNVKLLVENKRAVYFGFILAVVVYCKSVVVY